MKNKWICLLLVLCSTPLLFGQKKHKAYMVSNTHLDTQWLWTVQTTIDDYIYNLFAATLSDNPNEIKPAMEMLALPYETRSK